MRSLKKFKSLKTASGITLIALVVTIVVLIILATVSINAVLGENGLIKKAQQAKQLHESAAREEQEALNTLLGEYENALNGGGESGESSPEPTTSPTPTPTTPPIGPDGILPETATPQVTEGMTRVKYDSTNSKWVKAEENEAWYNYSDTTAKDGIVAKSWANVVIPSDGYTTSNLFDASGNLNENANYIQLVWIPRYAYQITSAYHSNSSTAGDIDIVFIGTDDKNGETTYSTSYPSVTDAGIATGKMDDFVVHPAFNFGTDKLGGFWVGKFETSTSIGTSTSAAEGSYSSSEIIRVKPGVSSRRNITIGNMFELCQKMKSNSVHGISSTSVDPHLMKNDEWGAVAYLSKSKYGKQTEEVWINNSGDYITGSCGNSATADRNTGTTSDYKGTQGVKASTNGNATGVYDMSGGAWEYVGGYVANNNANITTYGGNLVKSGYEKYVNKYETGKSDDYENNYKKANPTDSSNTLKHYGDALWETSDKSNTSTGSWFNHHASFPRSTAPFFRRGGVFYLRNGIFAFVHGGGEACKYDDGVGFRVVVPVL